MRLAEEPVGVISHADHLGQFLRVRPRHDGVGEDHHVRLDGDRRPGQRVGPADDDLAVGAPVDLAHAPADVLGAVLLDRAADELVVALARRPDVHVEDHGAPAVHLVRVEHGVLRRVHAADLGAVFPARLFVAAAAALHEHDRLRRRAVAGAADLARRWGRWPRRAARTRSRQSRRRSARRRIRRTPSGPRARSRWPGRWRRPSP